MNEPGAIPNFKTLELLGVARLKQCVSLPDCGIVGFVGQHLDVTNVSLTHKIAAHSNLPGPRCVRGRFYRTTEFLTAGNA